MRCIVSNPFSNEGRSKAVLNAILLLINTLFIFREDQSEDQLRFASKIADEVASQNPLEELPNSIDTIDINTLKSRLIDVNNFLDNRFSEGLALILQRIENPLITPSAKLIVFSDSKRKHLHDWATQIAMNRQRAYQKDSKLYSNREDIAKPLRG